VTTKFLQALATLAPSSPDQVQEGRRQVDTNRQGAVAFSADVLKLHACACMGPIGTDPYCPCVMEQHGLVPSSTWTEEERAALNKALNEMFGWKDLKREPISD
jgi:hypothetical protein